MKKILIICLIFISLVANSQVTKVRVTRIANATTTFSENISIGNQVYNVATNELWVATAAVINTATLTTASGSFSLVNGGASFTVNVTQTTHGFSVDDAIYHNGTSFLKGLADVPATAGVVGVVTTVSDVNNFTYTYGGEIPGTYTDGVAYFLSTTVSGEIIVEPTYNVGEVRQYIGMGTPTGLLVEIDLGDEITAIGTGGDGAPTDATYITQTVNSSLSNEQALGLLATGFMRSITSTGVVSTQTYISLAADVTGNLPVNKLNSGTDASSSTYWRGDGTWVTPAGGGNVSNTGTPANNQVAVFTDATTIEGDADFWFNSDNSSLNVTGTTSMLMLDMTSNASSVSTPTSNIGRLYANSDGHPHYVNDAGTDFDLTATGGTSDHSALSNLDYASAGHTDFMSTNTTQTISGAKTFSSGLSISGVTNSLAFTSGGYIRTFNLSSAPTGLTSSTGAIWHKNDGHLWFTNDTESFDLTSSGGTTDLSLGTITATTIDVNSSTGTNATLLEANTTQAGILGSDKWDEIVANSLKSTNVSTALTLGTPTATTVPINSDGSSPDITLIEATTSVAGLLGASKWDEIVANSLKSTNVTTDLSVTGTSSPLTLNSSDGTDITFTAGTNITLAGTSSDITINSTAGGNVSNTGTPLNNQLAIWTDATTIEGVSNITWDDTYFKVSGNFQVLGSEKILYLEDATISIKNATNPPGSVAAGQGAIYVDGASDNLYYRNNSDEYNLTAVGSSWNYGVQAITTAWDVSSGLGATITLSANSSITLSNLVAGMSGNLTVTNAATAYTITFTGYTIEIADFLTFTGDAITMSGGSKRDVLSWYYDGTRVLVNGTLYYH